MATWQLQEAKAKLSKVVKAAMEHGPQKITLRGESAVVVISQKELDRLKKPRIGLVELIRTSPLVGIKLDTTRNPSLTREIEF